MAIVLGIMSSKGGAGKSTITKLLASAFAFTENRCLIIDLDPNKDIVNWWSTATQIGYVDDKIIVRPATNGDDLFDLVGRFESDVDFILIDTKGEASSWAVDLASVSAVLVVPCMNAKGDRERTQETTDWYEDLKSRAENVETIPPLGFAVSRDGDDWKGLVGVLRSGSQIELTVDGKTFRLDTVSPFPVACGADA